MVSITVEIDDEIMERLAEAARERGLRVEELLEKIADDFLSRKQSFEEAAGHVLEKNAELYRRLEQ